MDVVVDGTFEINAGLTWTLIDVNVHLDGGAQILISGTATLDATNSSFVDCGATPWNQIIVATGGSILANLCEFRGAGLQAVHLAGAPLQAILTGNDFEANNTCLRITGIQNPANHTIVNNRFEISPVGISIASATNVVIGYNEYESLATYTIPMIAVQISSSTNISINGGKMWYMTTAVDAKTSSGITLQNTSIIAIDGVIADLCIHRLTVSQNVIRVQNHGINITRHTTNNPALTTGNIFLDRNTVTNGTNTAVRVIDTKGNGVVNIYKNTILPVQFPNLIPYYGIEVGITPEARVLIEENFVEHQFVYLVTPSGIYVWDSKTETVIRNNRVLANFAGDMNFGIMVAQSPNCLIAGNIADGGGNIMQKAISVEMTPEDIVLCCNWVDDAVRGLNMTGPHENCDIFNTTFNSHSEALYYDMVVSSNAPQTHRGNDWSAAVTTWDAYYAGSWLLAPNVFYTVDPTFLPSGLTKVFVTGGSASDWFDVDTGTETSCEGTGVASGVGSFCDELPGGGEGGEGGEITGNDEWAAGTLEDEDYAALHWASQRHLFAKLRHNPSLIGHSESISDFYTAAEAGNLALFHDVDEGLARLYEIPAAIAEAYWAAQAEITQLGQDLADLDVAIGNAQSEELPALLAQREVLVAQHEATAEALAEYEAQRSAAAAQQIADLQQWNTAISPAADYEADTKAMTALRLNALAQNDGDFDTTEKASIDAVAARCPQYNGPAVYHARFLQEYYRVPDWSDSDCAPVSERSMAKSIAASNGIRVYPNPASSLVQIDLEHAAGADYQLHVFSLTGQLMHTQRIGETTTSFSFPIGTLENGYYLLHIADGSRSIFRQKLAILR